MRHTFATAIATAALLAGALTPPSTSATAKPTGPVLTAGAQTATEGPKSKATVRLKLSGKAKSRIEVDWQTVDGSAKARQDYSKRSGTAVLKAGSRKASIKVRLLDDRRAEGTEKFWVKLASKDARLAGKKIAVVIRDDDRKTGTPGGGGGGDDGLQVALATDRATSHTFAEQVSEDDPTLVGATLTATGPDGTAYTLTVPAGALARETTVTMTPWKAATGTGVTGGRLAGVRLTPSGTEFLLPVTLTVDPPGSDAVPAVTFAHEDGDVYDYPTAADPGQVLMHVWHFSDYFGYTGDGISIQIVDPTPVDPAQTLASEIARVLREERDRQLAGEDPDPEVGEKVEQLLTSYYEHVVAPLLPGIRTDCDQAKAHNGHVISFARQAALWSILEAQQQTIMGAVRAGAENCLAEALAPCVDAQDVAQMQEVLAWWRQVLLLAGTVPDPGPMDPSRACKELLTGTITITVESLLEVNGFRTEESWTLVYQPRFVNPTRHQAWYDDGRGGWTVSGTYRQEDLRPDRPCPLMSERTYSGSGTLATDFVNQLDPETDRGKGISRLEYFLPWHDGNFGLIPIFDGEVVGESARTTYRYDDDQCVARTEDVNHWFIPHWGPGHAGAPGAIVDTEAGRGVEFDHTYAKDLSDTTKTDTYDLHITGSLQPTRG